VVLHLPLVGLLFFLPPSCRGVPTVVPKEKDLGRSSLLERAGYVGLASGPSETRGQKGANSQAKGTLGKDTNKDLGKDQARTGSLFFPFLTNFRSFPPSPRSFPSVIVTLYSRQGPADRPQIFWSSSFPSLQSQQVLPDLTSVRLYSLQSDQHRQNT
jgi:hypothetical protein